MGKFDEQIAWCRERLEIAKAEYADFNAGRREWSGPDGTLEMTDERKEKARKDVEGLTRLISAYEALDA